MARVPATLRLRAEEAPTDTREETSASRRIRWSEDVVDNEGMGKKSSKGTSKLYSSPLKQLISLTAPLVCCIYHKARPVGESSSESDSDSSSSDSDSDTNDDRAKRANHARHSHGRGRKPHGEHNHAPDSNEDAYCSDHEAPKSKRRKPSPNAYEKMPKPSKTHSRGT
jgi:protein phosphatase 1 regulatory subunit 11